MNAPSLVVEPPARLLLCPSCARARGVVHDPRWRESSAVVALGHCDDCAGAVCACEGLAREWSSRCWFTLPRGRECPVRAIGVARVASLTLYERVTT